MAIERIKVKNFKSFRDLDLELGKFNVVVGANASGKSNFVQIFKFLRDLEANDFRDAVAMNGGLENLVNFNEQKLTIETTVSNQRAEVSEEQLFEYFELIVSSIKVDKRKNNGDALEEEHLIQGAKRGEDSGAVEFIKQGDSLDYKLGDEDSQIPLITPLFNVMGGDNNSLLWRFMQSRSKDDISILHYFTKTGYIEPVFKYLTVYDIIPSKAKKPADFADKIKLKEDGSNLAFVLNDILKDKDKSNNLQHLVKWLLPNVHNVGVENFAPKSLTLTLQEKYFKDQELRADLLSDGTVSIAALIVAMYFEDNDVIIIEEPERSIHPKLMSGLVDMMKEVSEKKQIIVTTHNPEFVRHAGIDNLFLVKRNDQGDSQIIRPSESEQVKTFLKNDLGVDDLFTQDILDV